MFYSADRIILNLGKIRVGAVVSHFVSHRGNSWSWVTRLELLSMFGFSQLLKKDSVELNVPCKMLSLFSIALFSSFFFKHVCQFPIFICAIIYFHWKSSRKKCNLLNSNWESSKCSYNKVVLLNIMLMIYVTHWNNKNWTINLFF